MDITLVFLAIGVGALAIVARFAAKRNAKMPAASTDERWAWELLLLPVVLGTRNVGAPSWTVIAAIAVLGLAAVLRRSEGRFPILWLGPLLIMGAAAWVWVRNPVLELAVSLIGASAVAILVSRTVGRPRAITSTLDGVGVFLIANVVSFYVLQLRSTAESARIGSLESTYGEVDRIIFPLVDNLNLAPALAAVYLVATPLLLARSPAWKFAVRATGLASAAIIFLASNGRAALVVGVVIAAVAFLSPRLLRRVLPLGVASAVAFVAFFPAITGLIGGVYGVVTSIAPTLARDGGAEQATSLAHRDIIWEMSGSYWLTRVPLDGKFLGFGSLGQYTSGASNTYGALLSSTSARPELASVHNSYLQQLFDGGVVGTAMLVGGLLTISVRASRAPRGPVFDAAAAAVLAIATTGITEVTVAPGYNEEMFFLLVSLAISLAAADRPSVESSRAGARAQQRRGKHFRHLNFSSDE